MADPIKKVTNVLDISKTATILQEETELRIVHAGHCKMMSRSPMKPESD